MSVGSTRFHRVGEQANCVCATRSMESDEELGAEGFETGLSGVLVMFYFLIWGLVYGCVQCTHLHTCDMATYLYESCIST